jgi:DNA primase
MIVDELLRAKDIYFRPSGKDFLIRCLNPEHEDKNPSLRIDKTTGIFNCLSCGYSGNLFNHFGEKADWLQIRRESLKDMISAKLAETSGLSVPENAVPFDQEWRGISASTFRRFEAFQHNSPEFIGRVVIPVRNITNKIVAFCGRHQSQGDPKYLFHPGGAKLPLFPVVKPIQGRIILVEGIMDMINLHDKGLTNAVCAFGVNKVAIDKINILKIQGISAIDIYFDNDEAGQTGAAKLKEELEKNELTSRNVVYGSKNKDPGALTASEVIKLKEKLYGG